MAERIPEGITRQHILAAIQDFEAGAPHRLGPSMFYDVVFHGKRYPRRKP